ncbi:MAG: DUF512 domain-containing protein [Candidatus Marinimicrobia bacterium]|nr:DUF512 domain-containing protein [Candidatus Neomarinimicrobiota bacterium]
MKIVNVHPGQLGAEMGLKPGDRLLRINGKKVLDHLDYQFRITEENVLLDLEIDGKTTQFDIEKSYDTDLGVDFEEFKIRSCANDCVFCFVDQLPKGMRSTLYFRDGDYRLSYLHGHYITMTNMGQRELDRIVEQRLSPLYVSVHVTDEDLRRKLFLYSKDDHLLKKIDFLVSNGIQLHTQIVLMPGLNDGKWLLKTLEDIYQFFPGLSSCSIVPVGLTEHRHGLFTIQPVTPEYAKQMIDELAGLRRQFPGTNHPFIFFADEWYILADAPIPQVREYKGVDLTENGIGQVSTFLQKFGKEKKRILEFTEPAHFTIATGELIHGIFRDSVGGFLNGIPGITVNLVPIVNHFLGQSVTVSGLLTGRDIIDQLKGKELGEAVWVTHRILNDEGTKTLDDLTLEDMSTELGVPVNISNDSILEIFERNIIG